MKETIQWTVQVTVPFMNGTISGLYGPFKALRDAEKYAEIRREADCRHETEVLGITSVEE